MNWELFTAFILITFVLVITPGPIVTLVIATGASQGIRAALTAVVGTTFGNALLLAAIALGCPPLCPSTRYGEIRGT
jgi:threonine/homoserine/homoserine lactone efflux protein